MAKDVCPICTHPFRSGDAVIPYFQWPHVESGPIRNHGHLDCVLKLSPSEWRPKYQQSRLIGPLTTQDALSDIEKVFNQLRIKYLRAISLSPVLKHAPAQALSSDFNAAFQSLAGVSVERVDGQMESPDDRHWIDRGFDIKAKHEIDWQAEREGLARAIEGLFECHDSDPTMTYAELIALKPGFHETWHHESLAMQSTENPDSHRGRVFTRLYGGDVPLKEALGIYPPDVSHPEDYLGYAACAVTEGPIVRRRSPEISYFTELCRIGMVEDRMHRQNALRGAFHILDTWQCLQDQNNSRSLDALIQDAERFVGADFSASC